MQRAPSRCCSRRGGGASLGRLRCAIVLVVLLTSLGPAAGAERLVYGGAARSYLVHAPAGAPAPRPLFVLLHPGGSHAAQFRRQIGFDALAEAAGALAVYPEGVNGHWNDGRTREDGSLVHATDDVGFVLALVDRLAAEGRADPAAVHVAGQSNGGMLALRLACEHPARFRSVAAVSASLPTGVACPGDAPPLALLLVHGTADPILPFAGGPFSRPERGLGRVRSAAETAAVFAARSRCAESDEHRSKAAGTGQPATVAVYRACRAPLVHVVVEGGGHGWPGSRYGARMTRQLGPNARFPASGAIVRFALEGRAPD